MVLQHDHFDLMGKVVLQRAVLLPTVKANASMHDEACFFHVIKGMSRFYTPEAHVDLKTTDSLLMKCGSYLNHWFENESGKFNEAVFVHFYPDVLKYVYDDKMPEYLSAKKDSIQNPIAKVKVDEMISNYVESLLFYFDNPSMVTEELIKLKVKEIILLLVSSKNSNQIKSILSDLFNPIQYEFKETIRTHLFEGLSVEDLAIIEGLSLSSFKRKFKAVFGTSPTQYIKSKRLEKAQELLEKTSLRISDIAYDCGFNDISYFSKSFAVAFNCTPSKYRKMYLT